jgi:hypothetical protein
MPDLGLSQLEGKRQFDALLLSTSSAHSDRLTDRTRPPSISLRLAAEIA